MMAKPDWLVEAEETKKRELNLTLCETCKYYGKPLKKTKHRGKETVIVYACEKHPGCMNTKYSIRCSDYEENVT